MRDYKAEILEAIGHAVNAAIWGDYKETSDILYNKVWEIVKNHLEVKEDEGI